MDLEEWEVLSDDGFLDIQDDGGKQIFPRKHVGDPEIVFHMNYFICKSPISKEILDPKRAENHFLPPPMELERVKVTDFPVATEQVKSPGGVVWETDYIVSQVSFKKMKETEFVDMKLDSPRAGGWGIVPQIEAGLFQFEGDEREVEIEGGKKMGELDSKGNKWERENSSGVNILKWSLSGIGAICSFGVAAATICIIVLGSGNQQQRNKQQNHKIQFQIFTHEKRFNQVVNEAISAARGVPLTTAHFTYGGGHYDHGSSDN